MSHRHLVARWTVVSSSQAQMLGAHTTVRTFHQDATLAACLPRFVGLRPVKSPKTGLTRGAIGNTGAAQIYFILGYSYALSVLI